MIGKVVCCQGTDFWREKGIFRAHRYAGVLQALMGVGTRRLRSAGRVEKNKVSYTYIMCVKLVLCIMQGKFFAMMDL